MGFARTNEQKKRLDRFLNPNLELAVKLLASNLRLKILQNRYTQTNKGGKKMSSFNGCGAEAAELLTSNFPLNADLRRLCRL